MDSLRGVCRAHGLYCKQEKKRSSLSSLISPCSRSLPILLTHASPLVNTRSCALDFVSNPAKFFEDCRKKHGDTFVIYVFGVRMLCTFSPEVIGASQYRMDASLYSAEFV
jgi:hypothetical protein